jgi:hypothetical protein
MTLQAAEKASGGYSPSWLEAGGGTVFAIYLVLVVGFAWNPTPFAQGLAALGVAMACAHAALFYGWKNAAVLLAICLAITFTMENIGAATGFPFGIIGQSGEVADAAGHVWRVADLRGTTVVTLLVTMFFTSLLAMLRLATDAADR